MFATYIPSEQHPLSRSGRFNAINIPDCLNRLSIASPIRQFAFSLDAVVPG